MRIYPFCAAAAAILLIAGATPAAADVKTGVDLWQAGDYVAAVREWRPLADKGDGDAQFNMGQAYKLGRGVPADLKIARTWYEKAAAQGHGQAQANLGLILFQEGDRARAMPWISKAADRGDPRAQYVLGTALFNGDLVAKDWPRAYALMTRAAAAGLPQAATTLTQMDEYIPIADRQKGVALARRMEQNPAVAAKAPAPAPVPSKPPRVVAAVAPKDAPKAPATKNPVPVQPAPSAAKPAQATAPLASAGGRWRVQLGAYGTPGAARSQWSTLSRRVGALGGMQPSYEQAGKFTRLRVGPLASRAAAEKLCAASKAAGQACFPVAP